uniref:Retrotransposon protein, putative, unclassified n=1 Tax=Tanacetum cinerariifolium TaxID=118510 RepID=A0A699GH01_TANCI|nr:retrotransposon protein, putative, unclassified [Tanacetum cinerariifolium]
MQQKIERLQAQLGDQKDKSKVTQCVSDTLDPLPQKLENENVELEFQVPQKVDKTNDLSDPVTSHSVPTTKESKVLENSKVIALGMFRINPFKNSRKVKSVPNKPVNASIRTNPITDPQPHVITKKVVNSNSHGFSSTGVWKPKNVRSKEILASPKLSKPRMHLRLSPTGKMIDIKGKLIASNESNGDNACTPNPQEPTIKRFPNSTFPLAGYLNMFVFLGTVRFGNDYVAAILGFNDLQWGNILIIRVYFVEGLGHNLFLVGQFYDSDLEVAFRRNTCFIKNLEGVDLLKGNHTTNLYTINLHDMASGSPICLMARATSTKSWLWHQRLSYLNFDTTNDLSRNDLVTGLPKFKYHKEHLCPSFLLQASVIIVRTNNGTEFQNQVLHEYFSSVGITHQASFIHTPQQNGVVARRIRTLLEAARTIKLDISFLHVFGALCYPKNDHEDIKKLGAKGDIGFFIGNSANSCAYKVYNQRTKKIMETLNVAFDELSAMAFEQSSLKPGLQSITSGQIIMYDDHVGGQPSAAPRTVSAAQNHFFKGTINPTLFIKHFDDDILVAQVYVDDIIFGSTHPRYTQIFYNLMKSRFEMSMMEEMTFFLGLQVNQSPCHIFINQSNYVLEILKKYGMESCDPVGTPMEIKDKLDLDQNGSPVDATKYRSMIGALIKYVSLSACCAQVLWMRTQLTNYGYHFNKIPIYCDSKSAIAISCNPIQHSGTKHIVVRYYFIKEYVEKGTIELYFVKTDYQLADLFTKALPVYRFNYLVCYLGMRSLSPHELECLAKSQ